MCAMSCGQTTKKASPKTLDQLHREFVDVMLDSTASWKQVTDVVYPFADSVCAAAADEVSLKNRIFGQEWGYMTIELMSEKYAELNDAGKDADYDDVTKILGQIADGMMLWFYSEDEQLPHLWRDHYYVCHQHSEEPTNGFFHLMVTVGGYLVLFFVLALLLVYKPKFAKFDKWSKIWYWLCIITVPLTYLCSACGWIVAEVGRQPWTIQDLMLNKVAISDLSAGYVQITFWIFAIVFTALLIADVSIICKQISKKSLTDLNTAE